MGNANNGGSPSAVDRVTRVWRVPLQVPYDQLDGSAVSQHQKEFREGMHKPGSVWVVLRQDAGGECRVYVDGVLIKSFKEHDENTSSGPFKLGSKSTGVVAIKKNTSWIDTTWKYRYKLAIDGKEIMEMNDLAAINVPREAAFITAKITKFLNCKTPSGEDYVAYEIVSKCVDSDSTWSISRRYRDFCLLDMCLRWAWHNHLHFSMTSLPQVPPKRLKSHDQHLDAQFIESRTKALEGYLNLVLRLPHVTENPDVLAFFGLVRSLDDMAFYSDAMLTPRNEDHRELNANYMDISNLSLDDFESILVLEGADKLDAIVEGPTRLTQEFASKLTQTKSFEMLLQGIFQVQDVNAMVKGFERSRRRTTSNAKENLEKDFQEWCDSQVPCLLDVLKQRIQKVRGKIDLRRPFPPRLDNKSQVVNEGILKFLTSGFSECISCPLWNRLYASFADGLSFQALCNAIEGYEGPTLIVIEDTKGYRFGALASERWREENAYFNGSSGAMFSLTPIFSVYRKKASFVSSNASSSRVSKLVNKENNVQYMNYRSKTLPLGLGMGGELHSKHASESAPHPRFWIDAEFDCNFATLGANDAVFESGPLLGDDITRDTFQISILEVWGLGGDDGLKGRDAWRAQRDRMIHKQRQVDKSQFANNSFDREYLLNGTFSGMKRETNEM